MNKILVTGAGGFIGSHLTERLVELGFEVKAFIHYNSKNNWGWLEKSKILEEIEIIKGDIRDMDSVFDAMKECTAIFHLAALIGIPYSYVSPLAYIKTNIEGTYNILESSRKLNLENIIITSTSETYGSAQYTPIDEKHPIVGQSPYAASKIAADQLAISYYRAFNLPIKIVRPFNTYGPRQSARAVIPNIISQILSGVKLLKLGNLNTTRDFTYVNDTIEGFIEIYKARETIGEIVNIGMNHEISILNLACLIKKLIRSNDAEIIKEVERVRPKNSEVLQLKCDNKKIIKYTKWIPKYDLTSGITETIEWIKENSSYYKPDIYNI